MGRRVVLWYRFSEKCFERPVDADRMNFDYYASILSEHPEFAMLIHEDDGVYLINWCSPLAPLIMKAIEIASGSTRKLEINDLMSAMIIRGILRKLGIDARLKIEDQRTTAEIYDMAQESVMDMIHDLTTRQTIISDLEENDENEV